jgi:aspartate beta-hydroxylase
MRVADQAVPGEEGRCFVVDDSFEREIKHDGREDLVVLVLDMAHPGLDPAHRARLQASRPTPEDRIVGLMRERGIDGISYLDGEVVFHPGEEMRQLIFRYMRAAGVTGVEIDGDQVRWLQAAAESA